MKKILLGISISLILIACTLHDDYILTSNIAGEIMLNKELDLTKLNKFEWDSLIILRPYSDPQKIANELSLNLSNVGGEIKGDDGYNLIIFLKDKKAVKISKLDRRYGDFKGFYNKVIPKNKAHFLLKGNLYPTPPPNLELKN